jgi:Putative auto-transporter adhesin, head GIN domain
MKQYLTAVAAACLFFISCKKEGTEQTTREFAVTNFTKLNMGSNLEINVIKGVSFSVKAEGRMRDLDDMKAEVQNGELKIWFTDFMQKRERVKVNISMPSLVAFDFSGNTHVNINGFTETSEVEGKITGNSKATIQMNATQFTLDVSGNSELAVNGQAEKVWANVSGNSYVNTYGVLSSLGRARASGNSKIKIHTSQELFADASGNSFIYFKGNPGGKFFSESGNSKIIEE